MGYGIDWSQEVKPAVAAAVPSTAAVLKPGVDGETDGTASLH